MIMIKANGFTATFNGERWRAEDFGFEVLLNNSWDEVEVSVDSQYLEGTDGTTGLDALALNAARKFLSDVSILANQSVEPQAEQEGVEI